MIELPVEGFPIAAEAVQSWFIDRHGRLPSAPELTTILNAMAAREATPPVCDTGVAPPPDVAEDAGGAAEGAERHDATPG